MKLRAENLAKSYKGRTVVKDVSLSVEQAQIVGLLGPNGAGKTTSFYMIVGLVPMDHGRITLGDEDLSLLSMHGRARKGIGYLPQEASIFRKLTVAENIMAILETRKELTASQRDEKMEQLLNEFHITHIRNSLGMSLSGGNAAALKSRGLWRRNRPLCCSTSLLRGSIRFRYPTSRASSPT